MTKIHNLYLYIIEKSSTYIDKVIDVDIINVNINDSFTVELVRRQSKTQHTRISRPYDHNTNGRTKILSQYF